MEDMQVLKTELPESDMESRRFKEEFLTGRTLSARRPLMAEIPNLDVSDDAYRCNHGRNGRSWNEMNLSSPRGAVYSPNPKATGRSQLFGDMSHY